MQFFNIKFRYSIFNPTVSKKGYLYTTAWFNGNAKRFDIRHFREDEIEGYHLDKEAAQEAKKAFELFCARA